MRFPFSMLFCVTTHLTPSKTLSTTIPRVFLGTCWCTSKTFETLVIRSTGPTNVWSNKSFHSARIVLDILITEISGTRSNSWSQCKLMESHHPITSGRDLIRRVKKSVETSPCGKNAVIQYRLICKAKRGLFGRTRVVMELHGYLFWRGDGM